MTLVALGLGLGLGPGLGTGVGYRPATAVTTTPAGLPWRKMPRLGLQIKASASTKADSVSDSDSDSRIFSPPPNFKPPTPKRFGIRPDRFLDIISSALSLVFRLGTGVFVSGYSASFVSRDQIPPGQFSSPQRITGEALGVNRFGMAKMKDSVLMLASYETPSEHIFNAAVNGREDMIQGVSESVIMGTHLRLGTGMIDVKQRINSIPAFNYTPSASPMIS